MNNLSRRDFLKTGAVASGVLLVSPQAVRGTEANSGVAVGVIGPGRRATVLMRNLLRSPRPARIAALCDIYDDQLALAQKNVPDSATAKTFKDYHELLAQKDIDAVVIGTPPHNHPEIFAAAVDAGKPIYMEKPVAVDARGCREIARAARRARANVVIGFQSRYSPALQEAKKKIQEGALGDIIMVQAQYYTRKLPYREGNWPAAEERVRNWLMYREMSGDIIVEQNVHNMDRVNWFLESHPARAVGLGGLKVNRPHYKTIMDHTSVSFHYPAGLCLSFSSNQFTSFGGGIMETYIGTKGTLVAQMGKVVIYDGSKQPWTFETKVDSTQAALDAFLADILDARKANYGERGAESTLTSYLGLMAMVKGKPAKWEKYRL